MSENDAEVPVARAGSNPGSFIQVKNVWQQYGDQVVLERLNLNIAEGEFCTLVGASGCGKSTFLRLLLGQEAPSRGEILLDGQRLADEPDASRGVVFQRYSVFPHLTVLDNVALGLELPRAPLLGRLLGRRKRDAREQAAQMLHKVGLGHALDKYPAQLSGGMQQRLALAQALIMKPKVLLLDEPFGALDPGIRADIHVLMKRLWHETELTVVMVTHDMREAFTLGTRVIAFERPRDRPEERERYGALLSRDIDIWPPRIAGEPSIYQPDRDDPVMP
ncbi:MAG: ABC transporter ATP-binding protein, partial [Gammaproteobacteria bacterium]